MTSLFLVLMFGSLALVLLDGNWRAGLLITVVIGFLQDPIRKITPNQPSTFVGLVLLAFVLTILVIYEQKQGRIDLRSMFWTVPEILEWIPIYFAVIGVQAMNSFFRFGDIQLTALGIAFYVAPAVAIWAGYEVGCSPKSLQKLIITYLVICSLFAISAWLDFRGLNSILFKEVGLGIQITFEGFSAAGVSGLWRTSELAAWHLAAGACFSLTMAVSAQRRENQILLFTLAAVFAYLTIPTGRRKALVLVLVFTAFYLLLFSRRASPASRERVISSVLGGAAMAYGSYALFLITAKGDSFDIYLNRSLSARDQLLDRFQNQGIGAVLRALDVSQGWGLGVGAGANLGNLKLSTSAQAALENIQSLSFVSEGGGGRIVAELGLPGLVVGVVLAALILLTLRRNFRLLSLLEPRLAFLMLGLVAFGLANLVFFFSAAQVYSDPFILILLGICFGSFLAVPTLIARQQAQLAYLQSLPPTTGKPFPAVR
ncbi:MAG: hypothetical protein NTW51_10785 [Cyanobacteria bacterium]|nr:hypothetical protein [Cyanobacteriota bacterium]